MTDLANDNESVSGPSSTVEELAKALNIDEDTLLRRIDDVLARREGFLDDMVRQSEEMGLYDDPSNPLSSTGAGGGVVVAGGDRNHDEQA